MSKQKKLKSAAVITIFDAPNMNAAGRRKIIAWMRRQAKFLEEHHKEFAPRFRARYLYED